MNKSRGTVAPDGYGCIEKELMSSVARPMYPSPLSHRMSTVRLADIICVMEKGRIVGYGSHEELMQSVELYKTLTARDSNLG